MRLANFFVSLGEIDDMSTTNLPFARARRDAAVSESARRDVRRVGHRMMTSLLLGDLLARLAGDGARVRELRGDGSDVETASVWPPSRGDPPWACP